MRAQAHLAEPQMNATPLIDVLLVLLIMLIFTLPVATHAVKLNLPQLGVEAPPSTIYLDVAWNGDIFWDGEYVPTLDALEPKLGQIAGRANPPSLMVTAEKRAPYERVAQVLAAAQRARVERLGVTPVRDP